MDFAKPSTIILKKVSPWKAISSQFLATCSFVLGGTDLDMADLRNFLVSTPSVQALSLEIDDLKKPKVKGDKDTLKCAVPPNITSFHITFSLFLPAKPVFAAYEMPNLAKLSISVDPPGRDKD